MRDVRLTGALSAELIAGSQTAAGAFPASPVHEVYRYGWLRDGSWCAHAMDRAGGRASAAAWHRWVAEAVLRHKHRVAEALAAVRAGTVDGRVMLPARFTLDGEEEPPGEEEWPNFQLDCYGHWLWVLADHHRRGGALDPSVEAAARLVVGYLLAAAEVPCYDCWEEHPDNRHTSTLAAVAAGLRDVGALLGDERAQAHAERLRQQMLGPEHTVAGSLVRYPGDTRVDGSLLWVFVPYHLAPLQSEVAVATIGRIRDELLRPAGGVRRYQGDTFYGGAEWILLAASLGQVAVAQGEPQLAERLLAWIEASATGEGHLPEQVANDVQSPHMLRYWRKRWGQTATPLLWSHAMHLVLLDELGRLPAG
jgi:GH15 family glucan-1,4-alpha-glucosidase